MARLNNFLRRALQSRCLGLWLLILPGIVNAATLTVTTANDSGVGSLRQNIAASASGDTITFANNLSGATIVLTSGQLLLTKNLTLDASALTNGIAINGNASSRLFYVTNGVTAVFNSLTITNGLAAGGFPSGYGGGIYNDGALTLSNCTLAANTGFAGGALYNHGSGTIQSSTLCGNVAAFGGGVQNEAPLTAINSTFYGNTASVTGGGIDATFGQPASLNFCTLTANFSTNGGGIYIAGTSAIISNSIVAGNVNSNDVAGVFTGAFNLTNGVPLLAPLGSYGGPTLTAPPLPGSPAIDAGGPTALTADQRGLVRPFGLGSDIGAVEISSTGTTPFGNALVFNGVNQYVSVPNFGAIIPTNEVTVEFWAYTTAAAVQSAFILNPDNNNNRFNAHINYGGPAPDVGVTYWDFGNILTTGRLGSVPAPAGSVSNWVHYALVASQSGNYMRIYTNGVLCANQSGMTPFVPGSYELRIGSGTYHGGLDEFRVWNSARSQADIQSALNHPLTGNESGLLLYYPLNNVSGSIATNRATATGAAYNGNTVNNPVWANGNEPFSTNGTAGSIAYAFTTLAGGSAAGSADGVGDAARFNAPWGIAVDTNGTVFLSDSGNNTIRKITSAGVVTTIAGLAGYSGNANGTNAAARFNLPTGVALDSSGNLYVADRVNQLIRQITPDGVVSSIAQAEGPYIAVDGSGNIYSEFGFAVVKFSKVGPSWVRTTLAGQIGTVGFVDGLGTNALFNYPNGLAVDAGGNVYVCDSQTAIRKITPAGQVTTIAGGVIGIKDGVGTNAQFFSPFGIAVDSATNLYVADGNGHTIRKMTQSGGNWAVTNLAGFPSLILKGSVDGTGTNALFGSPYGVAVDNSGNVFVADNLNDNVRKITSAGIVTTVAGPGNSSSYLDGTGDNARFNSPYGAALDGSGNVYVADTQNHVIRKITPAGVVSTLAGKVGIPGEQDGVGNGAQFLVPYGVAVDSSGNLFVTDNFPTGKIRKVTPAGVVSTVAGNSVAGYHDGPAATAQFSSPAGIAMDQSGNLFITEQDYNLIRMISTNGQVYTVAGSPPLDINGNPTNGYDYAFHHIGGYVDGTGTKARFNFPSGIALDSAGNLYVADSANHVVRKLIAPISGSKTNADNWAVTTLAGVAGLGGSSDGTGSGALFNTVINPTGPRGLALDSAGNVYVTDDGNNTIRKITPAGVVTTLGGLAGFAGSANGTGSDARFNVPAAIASDASGVIYVVDHGNSTIRKGTFTQYGPASLASYVQPLTTSQLQVTMLPAAAGGQWRFPWEVAWRNSGQTASNLVAGNYTIQFRTRLGWLAIPPSQTVAVTNSVSLTNQYYPTLATVDPNNSGSLTVTLGPNPPSGAGWRFLGDTTAFYPSGYSTNLAAGTYLIEFAPVSGRVKPPNLSVQVLAGLPTVLAENYLLSQGAPGGVLLPFPVPVSNISNLNNFPFGFNGQLQSDTGFGSGVAVGANVVLTAAHVIFNDQTLSYCSQAYWYFQREVGVFDPQPLAARGWYVLSGYAAQRTNDLQIYSPDTSTPQSRNIDVAALYFNSPVAGGGYGGYLPSDATPNPWLTGSSLKMLVGYPVDGSEYGNASIVPGTMYQTQPQPTALSLSTDPVAGQEVYAASWFLSYAGNSGGPVYAQLNGYYYPAGVYLGTLYNGITPYASAVRAIDSAVVKLITNAAYLGDTGTNKSGGGVITIIPNQAITAANPGYVQFTLSPPAAVAAGAGWKLSGDAAYSSATNYTRAVLSTNAFTVQFKPIAGWNVPTNQSVNVQPNQIATGSAFYTVTNPMLVAGGGALGITGTTGTVYRLEQRASLTSGSWIPVSTNTIITSGFNLLLANPSANGSVNFYRAVWLP